MKHLKSYKLFESNHLLSDTIKDICLDLEDEGFYVINKNAPGSPVQSLRITKCDDDYIDMELCQFRPSDIKDTLDRVYHVIGNNLINTCLRLYNTHNTYYEIDMPISNKQFDYPNWRTYGIEIRFYQDGYQHGVNESEEHITPAQQEVIDDVTNMLADLSDGDYYVEVGMSIERGNYVFPGSSKLLTVEIIADSNMDMDLVSDNLIRLYDYMKGHQSVFNRNPSIGSISYTGSSNVRRYYTVGWGQFDKRNVSAYNQLVDNNSFNGVVLQWQQKPVRIPGITLESVSETTPAQQEVIDDVNDMLTDLTDEEYKVSVIMRDIYPSNVQDSHLNRTGIEKLLTVEIKSKTTTKNGKIAETDSMDMDIVSDYIIRLYDYMSEHQTAFNKTPATSFMSIQSIYRPGLLRNIGVVWKHLDKRNEIDYNRLLSKVGKGCGKLTIQWRPVWKVKVR